MVTSILRALAQIKADIATYLQAATIERLCRELGHSWRERLLSEGEPALSELAQWHPDIDVMAWRQRVAAARTERERTGASGAASRELFRALRAMFATMST